MVSVGAGMVMQTKKPLVYLFINFPILIAGCILCPSWLMRWYANTRGISLHAIPNIVGFFVALPAVFLWMPLALIISNFVLYFVPPLHRIADDYVRKSGHPDFWASQKVLFIAFVVMSAIFVPIIVYGFVR
jgi:hypothetical protein